VRGGQDHCHLAQLSALAEVEVVLAQARSGVPSQVHRPAVAELLRQGDQIFLQRIEGGRAAVKRASKSIRDLRIAEVVQLDMQIEEGKSAVFRTKLKVSFKYEGK